MRDRHARLKKQEAKREKQHHYEGANDALMFLPMPLFLKISTREREKRRERKES